MQKFLNRLKLLRDFYLRRSQVTGLPLELVIEVTNQCNLNCIMCLRKKMRRPVGFMEMGLFKKIIDEVATYSELVYLYGLGEPLFHSQIFEMISYAKSKGLAVGLSSNATLLIPEKARKLIESGLDYLIIALDAATPKTYAKVRGGRNFPQVVKNVKDFLELKKKAPKPPFTVLQFVKLRENEKETGEFCKMWQGLGADALRVKPVVDLLRKHPSTSLRVSKKAGRPCFYIWRQLNMVSWDGKFVTPCCMDANGDYPLGDVNRETISTIWNGRRMRTLRQAHLSGEWAKLPLCQSCTYPQPALPGKIGALTFPDLTIKKLLPFLENITFGKFIISD